MQQNSTLQGYAEASLRKPAWQLFFSFDKTYLSSVNFFKVGNSGSTIGGPDLIPGTNSVVQEWDKYQYVDYSDRVISIDGFTSEVEQISSVTACYGDIVLNNYDDLFTPGAGGPLDQYLLPQRPLRLYLGFRDQLIPYFVGVTDSAPVVDERAKTVSLHCVDFFSSVWDRTLDTLALSTNVRTDECISAVLVNAGLLSSQLVLDRGFNTLTYFSVPKGSKVIDVLKQLMVAEQGRLYMDGQGVIRFKNRQNYDTVPVMRFDAYNNIVSASRTREDSIVNVVQISNDLRTLATNQKVWESQTAYTVPSSGSVDVWADLSDPVTVMDLPVNIASATTSSFTVNTSSDGTGSADSTHVSVSVTLFSSSYKMTFSNSSTTQNLYLTNIQLYGTPYKATDSIYVRETDAASVAKYDERLLEIVDNPYFQNQSDATSRAKITLDQYSAFAAVQEIEVKGTPALELDDPVTVDIFGRRQTAKITRIQVSLRDGVFSQSLRFKVFNPRTYFRVGNAGSQIGGTDYISF